MRRVDPVYMSLAERLGELCSLNLIIAAYWCHRGYALILLSFFIWCWLYHLFCTPLGDASITACSDQSLGLLFLQCRLLILLWSNAAMASRFRQTNRTEVYCWGFWGLTDWNWQKSLFDSRQGFGDGLQNKMLLAEVNSIRPELVRHQCYHVRIELLFFCYIIYSVCRQK